MTSKKVEDYYYDLKGETKESEWIKESGFPTDDFYKNFGVYIGIKNKFDLIKLQNFIKNNVLRS